MENKDLLRYGTILDDNEWIDVRCNLIRDRIIYLDGKLYTHRMVNGEVVEIKNINEAINKLINKGGN